MTKENSIEKVFKDKKIMTKATMIYWRDGDFWLGKLLEHPDIMTQGYSLEELEENLREAYYLMATDDVPDEFQLKEIAI